MVVVLIIFSLPPCRIIQTEDGGGSVTLGRYSSIKDTENGGATMHFDQGQHCHAFGARTADVHVTCGAENRLLSASEPSTCYYSFKFESPAACTEKFAVSNGIEP